MFYPNGLVTLYKIERMLKDQENWRVCAYLENQDKLIDITNKQDLYKLLANNYSIAYDFIGDWSKYNEHLTDRTIFNWSYKDYRITIIQTDKEVDAELVKYQDNKPDSENTPSCFTLAYWVDTSEGFELKFVLDRPFEHIEAEDIEKVWEALYSSQKVLDSVWKNQD